jgi:hypothetical protein
MIRDMFEDETAEGDVTGIPSVSRLGVYGFIGTWDGAVQVSAEATLISDEAKSFVPFLPVILAAV